MPPLEVREEFQLPSLDASGFPVPADPAGARGLDRLRMEVHATLSALIDGDFSGNDGWIEREKRLCSELGRIAPVDSATPEFRQAVSLLKVLRATARPWVAQRDASVS